MAQKAQWLAYWVIYQYEHVLGFMCFVSLRWRPAVQHHQMWRQREGDAALFPCTDSHSQLPDHRNSRLPWIREPFITSYWAEWVSMPYSQYGIRVICSHGCTNSCASACSIFVYLLLFLPPYAIHDGEVDLLASAWGITSAYILRRHCLSALRPPRHPEITPKAAILSLSITSALTPLLVNTNTRNS
jgi:hypothetical protein